MDYRTLNKNNKPIITPQNFTIDKVIHDLYHCGYSYIDNFLPHILIDGLHKNIQDIHEHQQLSHAQIGRGKSHKLLTNIRTDKTHWILGDKPYEAEFLTMLHHIQTMLNQNLMLGLFDIEAHYAVYEENDFYQRHYDSFKGQKNRIVSLVVYFNSDWHNNDGGFLHLYHDLQQQEPFAVIKPHYNHAIFFLSEEIPHEVTMTHRNRYSIACWFRCRDVGI